MLRNDVGYVSSWTPAIVNVILILAEDVHSCTLGAEREEFCYAPTMTEEHASIYMNEA